MSERMQRIVEYLLLHVWVGIYTLLFAWLFGRWFLVNYLGLYMVGALVVILLTKSEYRNMLFRLFRFLHEKFRRA